LFALAVVAQGADKELKHDNDAKTGHKSRAGAAHAIEFEAPRGNWWVKAVRIHGARYGGGYDATEEEFVVVVSDGKREVGRSTATYDRFAPGRFEWVDVPIEPVKVKGKFWIRVSFKPTRTRGIFVSWCDVPKSHSHWSAERIIAFPPGKEWMIRAVLTNRKPKAPKKKRSPYLKDFEYVAKTVRRTFPAFRKKGVDWKTVVEEWRPVFKACKDDKAFIRHVHQLLATLGDMHSGVLESKPAVGTPAMKGLYGGGLWIAADRGRLVVRASLREDVKPGWALLRIGKRTAAEAHDGVRNRLRAWSGWSSTHFLDARLSFQFFSFDDEQRLACVFMDPSGKRHTIELERWGPGGKGVSRVRATLPPGVSYARGAVAKRLDDDVGYLRITGSMDDRTRAAFDTAFDALKGVRGILLDCRGMGGGGDGPAWAMAGRFKPKGIKATGPWQFEGPVVMLQDERMVSSAETFTWAMAESGRAVSVGRPTGGATIIPALFQAPSGMFRFRVGRHDRRTPFLKVQPEGIGTPPAVFVPYEPYLLERHTDPVYGVGLALLRELVAGASPDKTVERYALTWGCEPKPLLDAMLAWERRLGPDADRLADVLRRAKAAGIALK
jgi:C-terminal processing protease CtpA/Prc